MARETKKVAPARRAPIVEAAAQVFLRFGFKKTSMDDLARAVGLSRQGLYLHFDTKESLFRAAVLRIVSQARAKHQAALEREVEVEKRLLGAFEAMHGDMIGKPASEHMEELLETAASLAGPRLQELEDQFIADVAGILTRARIAAGWKDSGVSAKELAEHLYATSCGLKHSVKTSTAYRQRMQTALKIVISGARSPS